jgi:hypothetical protein
MHVFLRRDVRAQRQLEEADERGIVLDDPAVAADDTDPSSVLRNRLFQRCSVAISR